MKTKKSPTHFTGICKPLVLSIAAALATGAAQAADTLAQTPFYLKNQTLVTNSNFPKPNVMLFIDDSGSMKRLIGGQQKIDITKKALHGLLDTHQDKINWGLQTLHNNTSDNTSDELRPNMPGFTDKWQDVKKNIDLMYPYNGTPTTRRYHDVQDIVRNKLEYRCQKSYIVLMSDGDANTSCRSSNGITFNYRGDPDFGNQAGGLCLWDQNSNGYYDTVWDANDGLRFFSQTLATKDFKDIDGSSGNKYWNGHPDDLKGSDGQSIYKNQLIETFTVGFGTAFTERGLNYLRRSASKPEYYFLADNPQSLVNAFNDIFEKIKIGMTNPTASYGTIAPAVMSSNVPNMAAAVHLDTSSWSSQLRFFDLDAQGNLNSKTYKQPSFDQRTVLLSTKDQVKKIADFTNLDNSDFAISGGSPTDNKEWQNALLPWTGRSATQTDAAIQANAANKKYSQAYRVRNTSPDQRNLGDILDSPVSAIGNRVGGRQEFLVTAANDGMVHLFRSDDLAGAANPYHLKLSYIPADMQRDGDNGGETMGKTLKELAQDGYGNLDKPHRYMVNGGFTLRQTPDSSYSKGQQIFMAGAMGQGGRGAYALNIGGKNRVNGSGLALNGSDMEKDVPLFETAKGAGNTLGYTIGTPQIGRVSINRAPDTIAMDKNIRYATFLASGYRSNKAATDNNETALYIYDTLGQEARSGAVVGTPGTLIRKITVPGGVGGLSSPTLVDVDFDGLVDVVYAGDYGGNMYRFDLRGAHATNTSQAATDTKPEQWSVSRIYQGSNSQPITSAPAVSRRTYGKYVVIFGTGSDIYQEDLGRNDPQAVYGIFDDTTKPASAATQADLLAQTITVSKTGNDEYRFLSNNAISDTNKGWKVALPDTGERVVVKPTMILRTAIVSSRMYKTETTQTNPNNNGMGDVCLPTSSSSTTNSASWLMGLNAETGGALTKKDAYIDFKVVQTDASGNASYYANGRKSQGILSFTYTDTNRLGADGKTLADPSTTVDGDAGGSGTDLELGENSGTGLPKNHCFSGKSARLINTLRNSASDTNNPSNSDNNVSLDKLGISGPQCVSSIRRISWREII